MKICLGPIRKEEVDQGALQQFWDGVARRRQMLESGGVLSRTDGDDQQSRLVEEWGESGWGISGIFRRSRISSG